MSILTLLEENEWDAAIFKELANNDTGAAPGHQGGMVVPQDLRTFFPGLIGEPAAQQPTVDRRITADLYDAENKLETVVTRYQMQTWGGLRSPETRLTDNLGSLRNRARGDDYVLIQRSVSNLLKYRLILIRKDSSQDYNLLKELVGNMRWGVVREVPMSQSDLRAAEAEEKERETKPFTIFENESRRQETRALRLARSHVFVATVLGQYERSCCICGAGLRSPCGALEVQAAHIVPRHKRGADDARNGLALCRSHHWAFDAGLFSINDDLAVVIPQIVLCVPENQPLSSHAGTHIRRIKDCELLAASKALKWHAENVLLH